MTATAVTTRTRFGTLEQRPLTAAELSPGMRRLADLDPHLLIWRPTPELARDLPRDLSIALEVVRDIDGNRRFVPRDGHGPFVQYGWLAGMEMLRREANEMSEDFRFTHRTMKLIFDRVRTGREHLGRRFSASRDLYVRFSGRGGGIGASLLPEYVGRTADGGGHSWSIRELTERGRQAAIADGVRNPTSDMAIAAGLTLAAGMNPLWEIDPQRIKGLLFSALFDVGEAPTQVTEAEVDDVTERLLVCFEEHGDQEWAPFREWFSGRRSNLVQTLARKSGYAPLAREKVKAALLELGWRSYEYVTQCLSRFVRCVQRSLAEPLNSVERRRFDAMYMPQAYFGGLPLVLILERSDLLRTAITDLWEEPDDRCHIGKLHRLLAIYAALAPARRAVDRRFKQLQRLVRRREERQNDDGAEAAASGEAIEDSRRLNETVAELMRRRRVICDGCREATTPWEASIDAMNDTTVSLTVRCVAHDFASEHEVPLAEFLEIVASFPEPDGQAS